MYLVCSYFVKVTEDVQLKSIFRIWGEFLTMEDHFLPYEAVKTFYKEKLYSKLKAKQGFKKGKDKGKGWAPRQFVQKVADSKKTGSLTRIQGNLCYLYISLGKKGADTEAFNFLWVHFKLFLKMRGVVEVDDDTFRDYIKGHVMEKVSLGATVDVLASIIGYKGCKAQTYHVDMLHPLLQVVISCTEKDIPGTVVYAPKQGVDKVKSWEDLVNLWKRYGDELGVDHFPSIDTF